ncbi:MAG: PEP-CTERM sorting domain-containing protein [Acidobacteriota bacterium]
MKSRLLLCAVLVAVFAVPVFADSVSISFTNQGVLSGSLNSGITSVASDLAFGGTVIQPGPFATLTFSLGSLTGSLNNGGTFTGGTFELDNGSAVLFTTSFSGTWDKVGTGLYDLAGTFSTVFEGIRYSGGTNQIFTVSFDDEHVCLRGLQGDTNITATVVPEPGSLALLGTGLVGLAGVVRRKLGSVIA